MAERSSIAGTSHRRTGGLGVVALAAVAIIAALAFPIGSPAHAEPTFPELTGRITDEAGLIDAAAREAITGELSTLEQTSTDQIAVVTLKSLQGYEIEEYGYKLGRHWGIGQKDKDNGALLIVAPNERKVRIEVGRGLEPHLTDAMSKLIIDRTILPAFRRGDFAGGIAAGVRDMKDVLLGNEEEVKERAKGGPPGPGVDYVALLFLAIWIAIFLYVIYAQYQHMKQNPMPAGRNRRYRRARYDDGGIVIIPGGSSDWSGGGWNSGGGGGWSGGGGGFGGGGASGSW